MQLQEVISPANNLIRAFQLQDSIFHNALEDISDDQALLRPNDQTNHYNWLLGHVTTCRFMLANAIGLQVENPHGDLYFKELGNHHYKTIADIQDQWTKISARLMDYLSDLSREELDACVDGMPVSRLDLIVFYQYHEAYHLGQMGLLRKVLGFPTMKSN